MEATFNHSYLKYVKNVHRMEGLSKDNTFSHTPALKIVKKIVKRGRLRWIYNVLRPSQELMHSLLLARFYDDIKKYQSRPGMMKTRRKAREKSPCNSIV